MCAQSMKDDEYDGHIYRTETNDRLFVDAISHLHPRDVLRAEDFHPEWREPEWSHVKEEEPDLPPIENEEELKSPHIKEEEEEDLIEFPLTVIVKSEETDECDEDHCGGSPAHGLLAPLSDSDNLTSHSSDYGDDEQQHSKGSTSDERRKSSKKRKATPTLQGRKNTKKRRAGERSRQDSAALPRDVRAGVASEKTPFSFPAEEETGTRTALKSSKKRKAPPTSQKRKNTKEKHAWGRSRPGAAAPLRNVRAGVASEKNPFGFPAEEETGTQTGSKSSKKRKAPSTLQRRKNAKEKRARGRSRPGAAAPLRNVRAGVASEKNPFGFPAEEETGTQTGSKSSKKGKAPSTLQRRKRARGRSRPGAAAWRGNLRAVVVTFPAEEETGTQTVITSRSLDSLITECHQLQSENIELKAAQREYLFDIESLKGSDENVRQCTGISSYAVFMEVFKVTEPFLKDRSLSKSQQFMMTLLRLRFNLSYVVLSFIYGLHASILSKIFLEVINVLDCKLVPALVFWPDKDQVHLSMPTCFKLANYSKCISIIDCFEVFLEIPDDLKARVQTYSNSKSNNTVKYLISITPQGFISFVSKGWGGRTPDKYVTEHSGLLNFLLPGDVFLADGTFDIKDALALPGATLGSRASGKGKKTQLELDPLEVEKNGHIANVRKHVQRVIGMLRRKYSILESTVPVAYMKKYGCYTTLDRIVRVASALCNISTPVGPSD
ncbi:uncharacterized protein LOC133497550 isoform X1 [Syngnathoides biaculeatus]|uniref:uncharacterized protein LOC133497550 isoform X1 n=1 Tax=Syngnathoides biaculeatus TaxID=300417 RepID=UPI002ADE4E1F|nr:uncharacterized protein LOC133497550 isoform X1 [Syngnathoides biaculeatus]